MGFCANRIYKTYTKYMKKDYILDTGNLPLCNGHDNIQDEPLSATTVPFHCVAKILATLLQRTLL